jgi:hypothetical protein
MADPNPSPVHLPFDVAQQASYDFFYQYLHDEVERLRFNDCADPIEIDLLPTGQKPDYIGRQRLGHRWLIAHAHTGFNKEGAQVLKLLITLEPS